MRGPENYMEPMLNMLSQETSSIHSWKAFNCFLGHNRRTGDQDSVVLFLGPI